MGQLEKIVVGIDGSAESVEALRQAWMLAQPFDARIEVVTCWEFPSLYDGYLTMQAEEFLAAANKVLGSAIGSAFGTETPHNVTTRVLEGNPKSVLLEVSKNADMLVVGRRGHGVASGQVFGSVSAFCVAHAQCPVLVVHAPKPDTK